jgi:hypothetical protein
VCCSNHTYIIGTISNCQSRNFRHFLFYHLHYISLLLRTNPTYQDNFYFFISAHVNKVTHSSFIFLNYSQLVSINNDRTLPSITLNLSDIFIHLLLYLKCCVALQDEPVLLFS